jgi:UDP-glucuronate 4-epimerase
VIESGLGRRAELHFEEPQPGDPQSTCADIALAREQLGYEPGVPIEEGVLRYTEWFLERQRERIGSR